MSTHEFAGIDLHDDVDRGGDSNERQRRIKTRLMGLTQQGTLPSFWAPKRHVWSLPPGVRPWSMWDKKPELAMVVYDKAQIDRGHMPIRYKDGTQVVLTLEDFARCGRIVVDKSTITQIWTTRSPGQRDLHGHEHT